MTGYKVTPPDRPQKFGHSSEVSILDQVFPPILFMELKPPAHKVGLFQIYNEHFWPNASNFVAFYACMSLNPLNFK